MIVLDTHIWVDWVIGGDAALPRSVVNAMQAESRWTVSAISCFEVSLLVKRGKLELPLPITEWIFEATVNSNIESLPTTCEIAQLSVTLADIHRDPADRIIIATTITHNAKLASIDSIFPSYPELHNRLVGK